MKHERCCLQRHVARALWHLATAEDSRQLLVDQGGLGPLLRLAQAQDARSVQSRTLAQQALKRLAEDQSVLDRLQTRAEPVPGLDASLQDSAAAALQSLALSPGGPQ